MHMQKAIAHAITTNMLSLHDRKGHCTHEGNGDKQNDDHVTSPSGLFSVLHVHASSAYGFSLLSIHG